MAWRVHGAHAQRKKQFPELGVVREGFLEEEKFKPEGVCVGGWRRASAVECKATERSPQRREVFSLEPQMPAEDFFEFRRQTWIMHLLRAGAVSHWAASSAWAAGERHFGCR